MGYSKVTIKQVEECHDSICMGDISDIATMDIDLYNEYMAAIKDVLTERLGAEAIKNECYEESDLQKFVALYKSLGIELKIINCEDGEKSIVLTHDFDHETHTTSPSFSGDSMCYTEISFDKNGKFIGQEFC